MTGAAERNPDDGLKRGLFGSSGLRLALVLGSVLDFVVGLLMMASPETFLNLTHVSPDVGHVAVFWPRYVAVFLFVLPWFYMLPALEVSRYRGNIYGAVYGRFVGFVFYIVYYKRVVGVHPVFPAIGIVNLLFMVYYLLALFPSAPGSAARRKA
jgi:hypothetical protein